VRAFAAYVALMKRCWAQEPKDRPTAAQVHGELLELLASIRS
jgi:hypothetical protein